MKKQPKNIKEWLLFHGGRDSRDLLRDKKGYFVLMGLGNLKVDSDLIKIYLPKKLK